MKFAIVIVATGKYKNFLKQLIFSLDKYFHPKGGKKYFLYTDEKMDWFDENQLVEWVQIENYENPSKVAAKKFEYINKKINELKNYDYILYLDSDMEVVDFLTEEMFDLKDKKYFSVYHYLNHKFPDYWTVERNPISTAYLGEKRNSVYIQSCIWGTRGCYVEDMLKRLVENTNKDFENNVIAIWCDESHLNKFFVENKDDILILDTKFSYPEYLVLEKYDGAFGRFEIESLKREKPLIIHKIKDHQEYPSVYSKK